MIYIYLNLQGFAKMTTVLGWCGDNFNVLIVNKWRWGGCRINCCWSWWWCRSRSRDFIDRSVVLFRVLVCMVVIVLLMLWFMVLVLLLLMVMVLVLGFVLLMLLVLELMLRLTVRINRASSQRVWWRFIYSLLGLRVFYEDSIVIRLVIVILKSWPLGDWKKCLCF